MQAERRPAKPELPAIDDQRLASIRFHRPAPTHRRDPAIHPDIQELIDAEAIPARKIVVPERLTQPHPLIEAIRRKLTEQETPRYGLPVLTTDEDQIRVRVTRPNIARAMRILDALVKGAEARGFRVRVKHHHHKKEAILEVCGEEISFKLTERFRRTESTSGTEGRRAKGHAWGNHVYETTGIFEFEIDAYCARSIRRRWRDNSRHRVEDCLNEFFVSALEFASGMRRRDEEWEAERRELARLAQERAERERLIREEEERVNALVEAVEAWHLARRVREYVKLVAKAGPDVTEDWTRWALAQADRIDPTAPSPPSILDEEEEDDDDDDDEPERRRWSWNPDSGL